jgi:hypothetical protein
MSVTLEQSEVVGEELGRLGFCLQPNCSSVAGKTHVQSKDDETPGKAVRSLMRSHGVRREGVRCNILADRYAFNKGQRKCLPKNLRPPMGSFGSADS